MKTASFIFILIGMVTNFFTMGTWAVIGVVVGLLEMTFLADDNKSIAVGVLTCIFTSLLGGIFFLAWTPTANNKKRENKK